jgi:class 3 adenylate cyclase
MNSFREKLDDAKGFSEFVIALNLDIREFSDWSLRVDSAQTALYVKKIYANLIDRFFAEAAFVKPTGDGLLVIIDFEEDELADTVGKTVESSMTIVNEFANLCSDDPIVNFDVPEEVGIGISRGAASRLASDDTTLDYSGRVLNLASRLMDIARPKGVVFDSRLGVDLLPPDVKSEFEERAVYLKGVSPRVPIDVMCWPDTVKIQAANRFPIGEPHWEKIEDTNTLRSLSRLDSDNLFFGLADHPPDPSTVTCVVIHDSVTPGGRRSKEFNSHFQFPVEYVDAAGEPKAMLNRGDLVERLQGDGVGPTWPVMIEISYRVV